MDVIKEVKALGLPLGKYVVVGSGPMAVRGIKDAHDIDIVVAADIFDELKTRDWQVISWTHSDHSGQVFLRKDSVELYLDVSCGDFWPTFEELVSRADIIEGVAFASLADVVSFKKAYGREKHDKDIALIEDYLSGSDVRKNNALR